MELDKEIIEDLAKAAHEVFCAELKARGYRYGSVTSDARKEHSSLKPYAELPDDEKEQNRNNVRDIPNKLTVIGYTLVPARGNAVAHGFTKDEIEKLAEMEHERWMRDKLNAGWKYAKTTNKTKKLHQCIVDWDKLPDYEKDKDRILVNGIPKILARAGYTMTKRTK
jgi:hypothetical protein